MQKINGYSIDEAREFITFIVEGKRQGHSLSSLFSLYAQKTGRAKGSVRNYYYSLLKKSHLPEVSALLEGTFLEVKKPIKFTDEQTESILRAILIAKSKGQSVRCAIKKMSDGDDRLMLRYQNKYRNVVARQPERIEKILAEQSLPIAEEMKAILEEQIDGLYNRLAQSLREENRRLMSVVKRLTDENALLKSAINNLR